MRIYPGQTMSQYVLELQTERDSMTPRDHYLAAWQIARIYRIQTTMIGWNAATRSYNKANKFWGISPQLAREVYRQLLARTYHVFK